MKDVCEEERVTLMPFNPNFKSVRIRLKYKTLLWDCSLGAVHVTVALVVPMFVTLTDTGGSGSGGTVLINEGKHFLI